tara:strand:- start:45 stop:401 length:357 start_codon:yes stop_codon:yes gene_type:complete
VSGEGHTLKTKNIAPFKMNLSSIARSKSAINKAYKKPELIDVLMQYQVEVDNLNSQILHNKKTIKALRTKLQEEATLASQIKKGWERHQVELPAFVNDVRKAIVYTVDSCKSISFLID